MLARHEMAPADGFAPSPFRLTGGRTTVIPRWYQKLVPTRGFAPRSADYRSAALLLSYAGKWRKTEGMLPRPFPARSAFKAVPARWSGSSSKAGCRRWIRTIIAGSKIRSPACWTTRQKKCPRQELHLRPQGSQPCILSAELRGRKSGATARTCTRLPPIPGASIAFYASAANCGMPVTLRPIHVGNVVSC